MRSFKILFSLGLTYSMFLTPLLGQDTELTFDDLGKPFLAQVVYLELENPQLVPELNPYHIESCVGNSMSRMANVGGVNFVKSLQWARSRFSSDPYKHLKDDGRHYMIRIIAHGYGTITEKVRKTPIDPIIIHESNRYLDVSLHIINIATSKVEKVLNIRAESYPYLKRAKEAKKKNPRTNVPEYALYESLSAQAEKGLENFFSVVQPILEVVEESKNKVERVNLRFLGKTNKHVIPELDIVEVIMDKETAFGRLRSFNKIGEAVYHKLDREKKTVTYLLRYGKKALKKRLLENKKIYFTRNAKAL